MVHFSVTAVPLKNLCAEPGISAIPEEGINGTGGICPPLQESKLYENGDRRLILAPLFEFFELAALAQDFLLVALDRLVMFVALNLSALHLVAD